MSDKARLSRSVLAILAIVSICGVAASVSAEEIHKKGDLVDFRIRENPSTGYAWEIMMTFGLTLVDSRYIPGNPTVIPIVGSSGIRCFTLRCEASGINSSAYIPTGHGCRSIRQGSSSCCKK